MKPVLVTTSYRSNGKLESLNRAYLPYQGESATEQAKGHWDAQKYQSDYNTEIHYTEQEITSKLLRKTFTRDELPLVLGRICALEAVANGAPPIPEGADFEEWSREKDAFDGDYEFLAEVISDLVGAASDATPAERAAFREAYLSALFLECPTA